MSKNNFLYKFGYYLFKWPFKLLFGFEVRGREFIPKSKGVIVASNHKSLLDPLVMGMAFFPRELNYMAKDTLFINSVFAKLIKKLNAFPLKRGRPSIKSIKYVIDLLKSNKCILMFPEGTRSTSSKFLSGRPGVGMIALKAEALIIPAFVYGTEKVLSKGSKFLKFRKIKVAFGKPLNMKEYTDKIDKQLYQEISNRVMDSIAKLEASCKN
jgi:1-acyl-sn-glycerol-3-phosphate acyltransferase